MTNPSHHRSPYQGLIPYSEEDAPFFFGRDKETRLITANLFGSSLTLLYGASGVGKSSVLRAGVAHQLRRRDDVLPVVFNTWQSDPGNDLKMRIAIAANEINPNALAPSLSLSLADYLIQYSAKLGRRLMIILDQFEEYFLYHAQDDSFGKDFAGALRRTNDSTSFLISIREDFYAKLDRFEGRIPGLYDNYFRIEHLNSESARAAIEQPVAKFNALQNGGPAIILEPALVNAVLQQVETGQVVLGESGRGSIGGPKSAGDSEARIETPFLQLVMTRLWNEEMAAGSPQLRLETLTRLGGAESIVRTHLDAVMGAQKPEDQKVASGIFHYLVTPSGTKIAYTASDLAKQAELDQPQVERVLEKLSHGDMRILRPVEPPRDRPTALRYEIFHDVLAPAVLAWCAAFIEREKRTAADQRALEQEQRANEQARIARRLRRLVAALVVMILLSLVAVGFAFEQRAEAKNNEQAALRNQQEAEKNKQLAAASAASAADDKQIAQEQRGKAEKEKEIASQERTKADAAKTKADASEKAADKALNSAQVARQQAQDANAKAQLALQKLEKAQRETETQRTIRRLNNQLVIATGALHSDPDRSLWLSKQVVEEVMNLPIKSAPPYTESEDALRRALLAVNDSNITAVLSGNENSVKGVGFSPDGRLVVTASQDRKGHVWDSQTGQKLQDLENLDFVPVSVSLNHDGGRVLISGKRDLGYWNVQTGKKLARFRAVSSPQDDGEIEAATFRGDSNTVIVDYKKSFRSSPIELWEPETGSSSLKELRPRIHLPYAATFLSPDGKLVFEASADALEVWDTSNGAVLASNVVKMSNRHTGAPIRGDENNPSLDDLTELEIDERFPKIAASRVAFSPDQNYIAYAAPDADEVAVLKIERQPPTPGATSKQLAFSKPPTVWKGVAAPIGCLKFSPDNRLLLVCSGNGSIRKWSMYDGKSIADLPPGPEEVTDASFSPDGKFVLKFIADGTIEVWGAQQAPVAVFRGHTGPVFTSSFSADGKYLVTGGFDRTARIWKWQPETWRATPSPLDIKIGDASNPAISDDGELVFAKDSIAAYVSSTGEYKSLPFSGYASSFHPGKKLVAVAAYETRIELADPDTGQTRLRLPSGIGFVNSVKALSFSNHNNFILSSTRDERFHVIDARTGESLFDLDTARSAAMSPDEKLIANVDYRGAQVFEWRSEKSRKAPTRLKGEHVPTTIAFNATSDLLITGGYERQAELWDAATGDLRASFAKHGSSISSVAFSPNGKLLLSVDDYAAQVCEVPAKGAKSADLKCLDLKGKTQPIQSAAFSNDGNYVVTVGGGYVQVWQASATTERSIVVIKSPDRETATAAFSSDSKYVVSGGGTHLNVWTLPSPANTEQVIETSVELSLENQSIKEVSFSPDGNRVIGTTDQGKVYGWRWKDKVNKAFDGNFAVLSPDGNQLAVAREVGVLQLWDTKNWSSDYGKRIAQFDDFEGKLSKLTFSPDASLLAATIDTKATTFVWSVATGKQVARLDPFYGETTSLAFSADGEMLAMGGEGAIRLWSSRTKTMTMTSLRGDIGLISSIAFSPDGKFLVSGSTDGAVRVWNIAAGNFTLLRGHFDYIESVAFSPDFGDSILSASRDRTARIWDWQNAQKPSQILKGHTGALVGAVYSRDGRFILTSSADGSARLWDARTGGLLEALVGQDASGGAAFSADGKSIVVTGKNGAYLYRCRECGSASDLLAEVDEFLKSRPLLSSGKP